MLKFQEKNHEKQKVQVPGKFPNAILPSNKLL